MTHLRIENQNSNVEIVNAAIILKLYNLSTLIEENLQEDELLSDYVSLKGNLYSDHARQTALIYLNNKTKFPNLYITVPNGAEYVDFADPEAERVLIANNIGDGVGITNSDMSNIISSTNIPAFTNNTTIQHFDEFSKFGVSTISSNYAMFLGCTNLETIDISNLTSINDGNTSQGMFNGCSNLTSVGDTSNLQRVGTNVFKDCSSLTSIDLSNVISIGEKAFDNCSGLISCTIGNNVTSIGNNAFRNCTSLTSIVIPSGVTSIGPTTFQNCRSLTSIVIPDSVTSISNNAFQNCSGLTSCTIGSGVTSIGKEVFRGCSSLTSVIVNAVTPPTLGSSAFNSTNNCPIYVPSQSVETYKSATNWSSYADRIQAISIT